MRFEWSDILGYLGWTILIFLIFYLTLRILKIIHSAGTEEILWMTVFSLALTLGDIKAKSIGLKEDLKEFKFNTNKRMEKLEKKFEKLERKFEELERKFEEFKFDLSRSIRKLASMVKKRKK